MLVVDSRAMQAEATTGVGILLGGMLKVMRCADTALRAAAPAAVVLAREVNHARPDLCAWLRAHEADVREVARFMILLLHDGARPDGGSPKRAAQPATAASICPWMSGTGDEGLGRDARPLLAG